MVFRISSLDLAAKTTEQRLAFSEHYLSLENRRYMVFDGLKLVIIMQPSDCHQVLEQSAKIAQL